MSWLSRIFKRRTPAVFHKPAGRTYFVENWISEELMLDALQRFLQFAEPWGMDPLQRTEDWTEHDGFGIHASPIQRAEVFEIVSNVDGLRKSVSSDWLVSTGLVGPSNSWLVRYWLCDSDWEGPLDVTLTTDEMILSFETEVLAHLPFQMNSMPAAKFQKAAREIGEGIQSS